MQRFENGCPFDARARAARCETCCAVNSVPPCVQAFLANGNLRPENVIALLPDPVRALRAA